MSIRPIQQIGCKWNYNRNSNSHSKEWDMKTAEMTFECSSINSIVVALGFYDCLINNSSTDWPSGSSLTSSISSPASPVFSPLIDCKRKQCNFGNVTQLSQYYTNSEDIIRVTYLTVLLKIDFERLYIVIETESRHGKENVFPVYSFSLLLETSLTGSGFQQLRKSQANYISI